MIEVGCWAHARRKFVEAENSALLESHEAVARIRALYQIEESIKGLDAAGKLAARVRDAVPLLENLKAWLDKVKARSLPKSRLMEAVNYALNQWDALVVYTTNGDCAIDNNTAERAVKPFAIGRKTGCSSARTGAEGPWRSWPASPRPERNSASIPGST